MKSIETIEVQIPFGIDSNYRYIPKDVMKKALENCKGIPLVDLRKGSGTAIGATTKDFEISNDESNFIGEFCVWDKENLFSDLKCDMSFEIVKFHKENDVVIFDEVKINSVSVLKQE